MSVLVHVKWIFCVSWLMRGQVFLRCLAIPKSLRMPKVSLLGGLGMISNSLCMYLKQT